MRPDSHRTHVVIAYKSLPRYRVPFFESLRDRLDSDEIDLTLVFGQGTPRDAPRNEGALVDWGIRRRNRVLSIRGRELVWQSCVADTQDCDLVIVEQASRLLVNYVLLARQAAGRARVALWGHGANLQRGTASATSEWLKRRVSRLPHWWFAYTEGSKERVEALGYPPERITVVQNAQDTEQLAGAVAEVTQADCARLRAELDLGDGPVGVFLGSLSREKRLHFLLDAATLIAARRPDFRLLLAGDGEERDRVLAAATDRPWIRYLGRVDDLPSRARLLSVAEVLLVPGLVGLVALDSFAAGVPLVTTAVDFHSPEIEYVLDGVNGLIAPDPSDVDAYASHVLGLLSGTGRREELIRGCRRARRVFTLDAMVERFAGGVHAALEAR
jgi:glycosyltransferase involved in cell wall biosynthesis